MEHNMAIPLPTPTIVVKQLLLILDLNRVQVQCVHCPKALMIPFSKLVNMNSNGFSMYINNKVV